MAKFYQTFVILLITIGMTGYSYESNAAASGGGGGKGSLTGSDADIETYLRNTNPPMVTRRYV